MVHLLKRLELNGFKSFAGKTVLEFPAGITAIVGPNGSGKSNIVDAIRWLLGERDAKSLRGAKVEDLIFAGTPSRPRQSLAQASLHFENQGGFFPVDYAEISVGREVTRDGQSRYFLNQSEVRLKDLVDFFARVRLGTKGLVIVSQGRSDMFIQASPNERREMLEEMLGLREYQLKKARAENRLDGTIVNLEKVRALIEEIVPHLRSLKRQTGRWEKRATLELELQTLENNFFGSQYQTLIQALTKINHEISAHSSLKKALEDEKHEAETREREVEAGEPKEREELRLIKTETNNLLNLQQTIQKELGRIEAQIEIAQKSVHADLPPADHLFDVLKNIKIKLSKFEDLELSALRLLVKEAISEIEKTFNTSSKKEENPNLRDFESKLAQLSADFKALSEKISGLKEQEKILEKNQSSFHEAFKKAVSAVQESRSKLERWESDHQEKVFEKERIEFRLGELEKQIAQAGRRPEEFKNATFNREENTLESKDIEHRLFRLRGDLASIGEVDQSIIKEAKETEDRFEFLSRELSDTEKARVDLESLIAELSQKIKTEFDSALEKINHEFNHFFELMFGGGHARLKVKTRKLRAKTNDSGEETESMESEEVADSKEEKAEETGVEVELSLPRKRVGSLDALSGGERSLVGIAALFAMISVSPPPFLVLDEIDAALDERNTRRFAEILKEFAKKTQFVIVTHNRASMEVADVLYGVTLNQDGTSKILSLKLEPTP
jgi:chromosome segregation protein